jgi:hypothetical protein
LHQKSADTGGGRIIFYGARQSRFSKKGACITNRLFPIKSWFSGALNFGKPAQTYYFYLNQSAYFAHTAGASKRTPSLLLKQAVLQLETSA